MSANLAISKDYNEVWTYWKRVAPEPKEPCTNYCRECVRSGGCCNRDYFTKECNYFIQRKEK